MSKEFRPAKNYPTAEPFHRDGHNFDLFLSDEEAHRAYFRNIRQLNGVRLKTVAANSHPVTVGELKGSLEDGTEWREERMLDPDGPEVGCGRCLKQFQPVLIPFQRRDGTDGFGGNFKVAKADEVARLSSELKVAVDRLTAELVGDQYNANLTARIVPICEECRKTLKKKGFVNYYYSREGVVDELFRADEGIRSAMNRRAFDDVLGGRPNKRRDQGGAQQHRHDQQGNTSGRNRGPWKPQGERKSFHGLLLFPNVVEILVKAVADGKIEDSVEGLLAKSPRELEELGITNAAKVLELAQGHLDYLSRQANVRQAAGEASVSLGDSMPSDVRQLARPNKGKSRRAKARQEQGV